MELDTGAAELDERRRFPICQPEALVELLEDAGLERVNSQALEIATVFPDFDNFWAPFLGGTGSAPTYVGSLHPTAREKLRLRLKQRLAPDGDGPLQLSARAWAARGFLQADPAKHAGEQPAESSLAGNAGLRIASLASCGGAGTSGTSDAKITTLDQTRTELRSCIEDVTLATAYQYGVKDDRGNVMDTVKVIPIPETGVFAGVYHSYRDDSGAFYVHLATSNDLMIWKWRTELAAEASQPTIQAAPDGGYVLAWEQEPENHLKFAYYSRSHFTSTHPATSTARHHGRNTGELIEYGPVKQLEKNFGQDSSAVNCDNIDLYSCTFEVLFSGKRGLSGIDQVTTVERLAV